MKDTANQMVDLIRGIIREEIGKQDSSEVCQVDSVNVDGSLNVRLLSDETGLLTNITNGTPFEFQSGDYAILYKIKNSLGNCFVFGKPNGRKGG